MHQSAEEVAAVAKLKTHALTAWSDAELSPLLIPQSVWALPVLALLIAVCWVGVRRSLRKRAGKALGR